MSELATHSRPTATAPCPHTANPSIASPSCTPAPLALPAVTKITSLGGDQPTQPLWPLHLRFLSLSQLGLPQPSFWIPTVLYLSVCLFLLAAWRSSNPDDPNSLSVLSRPSPGGLVTLSTLRGRPPCSAVAPQGSGDFAPPPPAPTTQAFLCFFSHQLPGSQQRKTGAA